MRGDLLHAQASVDWALAQFPSLQERIRSWCELNVRMEIKELPPDVPNNVIIAVAKETLPLAFNVEVGAYINAIRSSLDILVTTLAVRHGIPKAEEAYFPIVKSATVLHNGSYKGAKLIKALPATERGLIESLKPYQGGNKLLWAIHQLDIMRKHRRLLSVVPRPASFGLIGWNVSQHFTPVATGWIPVNDEETVLGLIGKGAPN